MKKSGLTKYRKIQKKAMELRKVKLLFDPEIIKRSNTRLNIKKDKLLDLLHFSKKKTQEAKKFNTRYYKKKQKKDLKKMKKTKRSYLGKR